MLISPWTWPARHEQPALFAQTGLETHDVYRALGPDKVERTGCEVELSHVCDAGFESVREPETLRLAVQLVDERSVIVDGYETSG